MVEFGTFAKAAAGIAEDMGALKDGKVLKEAGDAARRLVDEVIGAPPVKAIVTGASKEYDTGAAIPDVLRPFMRPDSVMNADKVTEIGDKFKSGVAKLFGLPREHLVSDGDSAHKIATDVLNGRSALTGVRVNDGTVAKEVTRLQGLNPDRNLAGDSNTGRIVAYDDKHLADIAGGELMFNHVPPIGQFFKSATNGRLTDADLDAAFAYQKTLAPDAERRFIGEILEDQKKLTPDQNLASFDAQNGLKAYLKSLIAEVRPAKAES